jgi:hypothetical protein
MFLGSRKVWEMMGSSVAALGDIRNKDNKLADSKLNANFFIIFFFLRK